MLRSTGRCWRRRSSTRARRCSQEAGQDRRESLTHAALRLSSAEGWTARSRLGLAGVSRRARHRRGLMTSLVAPRTPPPRPYRGSDPAIAQVTRASAADLLRKRAHATPGSLRCQVDFSLDITGTSLDIRTDLLDCGLAPRQFRAERPGTTMQDDARERSMTSALGRGCDPFGRPPDRRSSVGGPPRRDRIALLWRSSLNPDHPARPAASLQQHLQLGRRALRGWLRGGLPGRRHVPRR